MKRFVWAVPALALMAGAYALVPGASSLTTGLAAADVAPVAATGNLEVVNGQDWQVMNAGGFRVSSGFLPGADSEIGTTIGE
jgi:hypothetical protein